MSGLIHSPFLPRNLSSHMSQIRPFCHFASKSEYKELHSLLWPYKLASSPQHCHSPLKQVQNPPVERCLSCPLIISGHCSVITVPSLPMVIITINNTTLGILGSFPILENDGFATLHWIQCFHAAFPLSLSPTGFPHSCVFRLTPRFNISHWQTRRKGPRCPVLQRLNLISLCFPTSNANVFLISNTALARRTGFERIHVPSSVLLVASLLNVRNIRVNLNKFIILTRSVYLEISKYRLSGFLPVTGCWWAVQGDCILPSTRTFLPPRPRSLLHAQSEV